MQHLHLLLVVGHAVNESHSAAGIVGKLAHIEQILWIFLLLVVALDPFMLLGAMLLVLETQKYIEKSSIICRFPLTLSLMGNRRIIALTGRGKNASNSSSRPMTSVTDQAGDTPSLCMYLVSTWNGEHRTSWRRTLNE